METSDIINDISKTLKQCLEQLHNGYLTTPAEDIKRLAIRLDNEGIGVGITRLLKQG